MATKTRIELIYQALESLGVLAAGQTPAAEDFAAVDGHVDALIATLAARDLVTVDDIDAIPMEWFLSLAVLLADRAANTFGLPSLPMAPGTPNPVAAAEAELREIIYARPTFEPLRAEYF
jgi:hypothetical protein